LKILILKPSSLGDVVQALPVLRLIKQQLPSSEIFWWIDSNLSPLLENDPDLAGVVQFNRREAASPGQWGEIWRSVRWMRDQAFDWVIDLQGLFRSGVFAWLANGQITIGLDEPREWARGFYDVIVRRPSYHTHAVDWYLGVLPALGLKVHRDFTWLPARPGAAAEICAEWGLNRGRWIILQPGARWLNKRWPSAYFAEVVRQLASVRDDLRFAILGGADDTALGAAVAAAAPERCLDLTGKLSLPEMVECIRLAELMITNDTGPMHVAAAIGKPVVALFGPTEPRRTGPYGQLEHVIQRRLPCLPCMSSRCCYSKPFDCLRSLAPDPVVAAVEERLGLRASEDAGLELTEIPTASRA
jgi:lipopolysaccharide heptosyltransferase I